MATVLKTVNSSVSRGAFVLATSRDPSVPAAPGLLSTTTGRPRDSASLPASKRPTTSTDVPAVNGTTTRKVRPVSEGSCAPAGGASKAKMAGNATVRTQARSVELEVGFVMSVSVQCDDNGLSALAGFRASARADNDC